MNDFSLNFIIKPEWRQQLLDFHDNTTLAQRLQGRRSINIELENIGQGWCRYSYCPAEYDEHGNLDKVLFTCECIDEEVKELQKLKLVAEYDGLTGLRSRYGGEQLIRDLLSEHTPGVFTVMDVDGFKSVNDTFGHAVGDKVLAAIGKVCVNDRQSVIIRQGGDEFVGYCTHDLTLEEARAMFETFLQTIEAIDIPELQGRRITMSIGAVRYNGKSDTTFDELFRKADHLLYASKRFDGSHLCLEEKE